MKKLINYILNIIALRKAKNTAIQGLITFSKSETYYEAEKIKVESLVEEYTAKIKCAKSIEEIDLNRLNAQELIDDILSIEKLKKIAEIKAKFGR